MENKRTVLLGRINGRCSGELEVEGIKFSIFLVERGLMNIYVK